MTFPDDADFQWNRVAGYFPAQEVCDSQIRRTSYVGGRDHVLRFYPRIGRTQREVRIVTRLPTIVMADNPA